MPIPLGILAAAGARPAVAAGAYELIETITVSGSSTSSITFSNLNTYSSVYQHLQIRYTGRTTSSSAHIYIRFNGDSGANYSYHWLSGRGTSLVSEGYTNDTGINPYAFVQGTDTANIFAGGVIDILDPYESKNKTLRMLAARPGASSPEINLVSGSWRNTTGLTSVTIGAIISGTNFAANSRFSIYGLKASA